MKSQKEQKTDDEKFIGRFQNIQERKVLQLFITFILIFPDRSIDSNR